MTSDLSRRMFLGASAGGAASMLANAGSAAEVQAGGKLKIVGVTCSPRKGRTTAQSMAVCLDAAKQHDPNRIETQLIELAGLSIPGQLAAGEPLRPGETDDFPALVPHLSGPDVAGIIIGTPVYFANMSSLCKAFLDRWIVFRKKNFAMSGKIAGVLAVGGNRNGGVELTIRSVQAALISHQMIIVGDGLPTAHFGATICSGGVKDVTKDEVGMATAKNLGRRVAEMAMLVRRAG